MNTVDATGARRVAHRLVFHQAAATLVVAALFMAFAGEWAALSALIGGGIAVAASLAMVALAFRVTGDTSPRRVMHGFYRGEAVKLGVTVLLFAAAIRSGEVAVAPLFTAYIATYLVYWVALLRN